MRIPFELAKLSAYAKLAPLPLKFMIRGRRYALPYSGGFNVRVHVIGQRLFTAKGENRAENVKALFLLIFLTLFSCQPVPVFLFHRRGRLKGEIML